MTFVPTPVDQIPTADEILARLTRNVGDPATGYITPDDLAFAWQAFLSKFAAAAASPGTYNDSALTARVTAVEGGVTTVQQTTLPALTGRVTAVEGEVLAVQQTSLPALSGRIDVLDANDTALTNRANDNDARLNDLTDASPTVWVDGAFASGSVVRHNGSTWLALAATALGEVPGVSAKWGNLTLESLYLAGATTAAALAALTARVTALENVPPPAPPPDPLYSVSEYVETMTQTTVTSPTLVDIPGMSATVVVAVPSKLLAIGAASVRLVSGTNATVLGLAMNFDGVDHDEVVVEMFQDSDRHSMSVVHGTDTIVQPGTYTVKMRYRRVSGSATPGVTRADMAVLAIPVDPLA